MESNTDGYDGTEASVDGLPYVFCFDNDVGAYVQHFFVESEFVTIEIDLSNAAKYHSCLWLDVADD